MNIEKKKDNNFCLADFLLGCVFVSSIVWLIVSFSEISKEDVCSIYFETSDLEYHNVPKNTITTDDKVLRFEKDNISHILAIKGDYGIVCYNK